MKIKHQILIFFIKTRWQIFVATSVTIGVFLNYNFYNTGSCNAFSTCMGILSSVLTLVGTVSFGHLLFFIQGIKSEESSVYTQFKKQLRNINIYLEENPEKADQLSNFREIKHLLLDLQFKELQDFPLKDYKQLPNTINAIENELESSKNIFLFELLSQLFLLKELLSHFGVIWVKKIVASRLFKPIFIKIFMVLSLTLISILAVYSNGNMLIYLAMVPIFVGVFTILIFCEMIFYISKDIDEL